MKKCKSLIASCAIMCTALALPTVMYGNGAYPTNLKATVQGTKVDLTWERTETGTPIVTNDFETAGDLGEGWTQKITNDTDYKCSWFQYPTDEIIENLTDWEFLINNGEGSAVVMWDSGWHDGEPYIQDEWLMTPIFSNGAFLDFYCYINPQVLEYAMFEEFPDHYYVKLSKDGGETWEVLWDARTDCSPIDAWQLVSIPLGETGDNAMIAFEAMGDQNPENDMMMYFSWAIDDVTISSNAAEAAEARRLMAAKKRGDISKLATHREFTPKDGARVAKPARTPMKAPAAFDGYYNLYLDDTLLAGELKTLNYTDISDKDPGEYTYKVAYYNLATEKEEASEEVLVTIEEQSVNPPRNLTLGWFYDENSNSYETTIKWEAPEGDRVPAYYSVYRDGSQIAYYFTDYEYGQSMMPRGVFEYSVSATYEYPEETSEEISDFIAIDCRYPVKNLKYDLGGGIIVLSWDAPKAEEGYTLSHYNVYRGNDLVGENLTDTKYTDDGVVNGLYSYAVVAVYTNEEEALPAFVNVDLGAADPYALPFSENFDGGKTPANWRVINHTNRNESYMWRFDNYYELPVEGGGFSNEFASINTLKTGYNIIESTLATPAIKTDPLSDAQLFVSFDIDYYSRYFYDAQLVCSVDGGESWITIDVLPCYTPDDLTSEENCKPENVVFEITDFVVAESIQLGWYYNTYIDGHLAIDNVKVYDNSTTGIENLDAVNDVEKIEYTDLLGRPVNAPAEGVFIKTIRYNDGSVKNVKVVK